MIQEKNLLPLAIRGVNLPNTLQGEQISNYCIGIDWLEFTALSQEDNLPIQPFLFTHENAKHGTKYYNELFNISTIVHGEEFPFAQLQTKPRPSFLNPRLVQVKLENRFCYTQDIGHQIERFCTEYKLTFKNITRLDLFVDFQDVQTEDYKVQQFLQKCAARQYVMKGKSMTTHHTRNIVTGITWGVRSSGMSITIYDKSLEMQKKTHKPWIQQLWDSAKFDTEKPTYRLEFSIKKPKYEIINPDSETLSLLHDLSIIEKVKPLIDYCIKNHFQIAINEAGQRFSRMKRIYPINMEDSNFFNATSCYKPKSSNYTKAYIKRLAIDALFYQKSGNKIEASMMFEHILTVLERYQLHPWFYKKFHWLNLKPSIMNYQEVMTHNFFMKSNLKQGKIELDEPNWLKNFNAN